MIGWKVLLAFSTQIALSARNDGMEVLLVLEKARLACCSRESFQEFCISLV